MSIRAVVVTISDGVFSKKRDDKSGPELAALLEQSGATVQSVEIVPDERPMIAEIIEQLADSGDIDLVVTTGGTGFSPRDITPEATADILDREAPGIAEAIRYHGLQNTPRAALSRGRAGLRGKTLVVNLPGSVRAVREGMAVLGEIMNHAVEIARGEGGLCGGK
ncbi:MAG: MogA/MoaB family molybdenum cofactor biosynthesis protein [bacterium]|mgnify:CR=1 FL=1|jgi:molybdenum cofactor synthesis domain-containing protein|nr:MogA/MoaB family molybdenum cofactor biosynthesis protein [bacterium]